MNNYRPWSPDDIKQLGVMITDNISLDNIRSQLNRSTLSIKEQIRILKSNIKSNPEYKYDDDDEAVEYKNDKEYKVRRTEIEKAAIDFLDLRSRQEPFDKIWEQVILFQSALDEHTIEQNEVNITIDTNEWIGVAFIGDLHIGNMATDYKTMLEHRDIIARNKNVYVAFNGDYCDNYIPSSHASGMFEALFPPTTQKSLAKNYIKSIKNKVLALVAGCHDYWSMKASDFDLTEYLAKHGMAAYLGSGGTLNLTVGKQTYKIMMRHKYRYNSAENPTSTVKKMFEKCGGFDVGCISHHHTATIEECIKEGLDGALKRLFIRAGTYKVHDRFAKQMGFSEGHITVPIVLLNPNTRDIRGFQNLSEGIEYLKYLNSRKIK